LLVRPTIIVAVEDAVEHVNETLYERAGGDEGLHRLEEPFYAKALADPILKHLFTHRVPTHVDHLTWFTAESFGDLAGWEPQIFVPAAACFGCC
jgi:hypothetical protein